MQHKTCGNILTKTAYLHLFGVYIFFVKRMLCSIFALFISRTISAGQTDEMPIRPIKRLPRIRILKNCEQRTSQQTCYIFLAPTTQRAMLHPLPSYGDRSASYAMVYVESYALKSERRDATPNQRVTNRSSW